MLNHVLKIKNLFKTMGLYQLLYVLIVVVNIILRLLTVRNIPKFKDRANWSRDTFQPMRRRTCVYQQTNQNTAPVIKNFQNNGRSRTESVIVSRLSRIFLRLFMMRHTIFLSGQRIGSHIGSVS